MTTETVFAEIEAELDLSPTLAYVLGGERIVEGTFVSYSDGWVEIQAGDGTVDEYPASCVWVDE